MGRGDQFRRPGEPRRPRFLHPQRALLARGISLRRAALRCRARDHDDSEPHVLTEIARAARAGPRAASGRSISCSRTAPTRRACSGRPAPPRPSMRSGTTTSHHCLHVILTGETDGYYADYASARTRCCAAALAEGFAYQGEVSRHLGNAARRAAAGICRRPPSSTSCRTTIRSATAPTASAWRSSRAPRPCAPRRRCCCSRPRRRCSSWARNGERPSPSPTSATSSPSSPTRCGEGRRREFARFGKGSLPDPCDRVDIRLGPPGLEPPGRRRSMRRMLDHYRRLLAIRRRDIVPLMPRILGGSVRQPSIRTALSRSTGGCATTAVLHLLANLTDSAAPVIGRPAGRMIFATHPGIRAALARNELAPWSVTWLLERSMSRADRGTSLCLSRNPPTRRGGADSARHLPRATQCRLHLQGRDRDRPLPRRAGREPRLLLALFPRARGQCTRL